MIPGLLVLNGSQHVSVNVCIDTIQMLPCLRQRVQAGDLLQEVIHERHHVV